jgi:hypothetical protein
MFYSLVYNGHEPPSTLIRPRPRSLDTIYHPIADRPTRRKRKILLDSRPDGVDPFVDPVAVRPVVLCADDPDQT